MRRAAVAACLLLLLPLLPATGSSEEGGCAPTIPVLAFFGAPEFSSPRLSPDGRHVAALHNADGVQVVVVRKAQGGRIRPAASISDKDVRLAWLEWANPDRLLVSVQMRDRRSTVVRARMHRLFGVDRDGSDAGFLGEKWPKFGQGQWEVQFQDDVVHWLPDDPKHVLVEFREPTGDPPSVKRMSVESGRLKKAQNGVLGIDRWYADHGGVVRVGEGYDGTRYELYARVDGESDFEKIQDFDLYEGDGLRFRGFAFDPATIYVSRPRDGRAAIYEYDLSAKALGALVFAHPFYDAGELVFDRLRRKLVGVAYVDDAPQIHFLDETARLEQASLDHALPGTSNRIVSRSLDGQRAIIERSSDTQPPKFYLFLRDTTPKRLDPLVEERPTVPVEHLVPMRRVSYTARDGLEIPAYLTVPKGLEPRGLPVVLILHGGPSARDYRRFDPEVQLLANRGFAVFQPNFRGSTGYGSRHRTLGYRQWGGTMQDDVEDGVKWLILQGIADPDRIGVYGASYGGYAALMGLVKTPELFRAGASYAGVTSLPMMLSDDEHYLFSDHNRPQVGGGWGDRKRLEETSPLDRAARIQAPVLLAHGVDDPIVHVKHSQRMASALEKAGKPVEYLEFEDEYHGFLHAEDAVRFYERLVAFFEESLRPRDR